MADRSGTSGPDLLEGTSNADFLDGRGGNDTVRGYAGNDDIYGWTGDDVLYGYDGIDYIFGEDGNDSLYGDAQADSLDGGAGHDYLDGWTGNDTLLGGLGNDDLYGWTGSDELYGNDGIDYLFGEDGNDTLYGGAQADSLEGGIGQDWLFGGAGGDELLGGADDDSLYGEGGSDTLGGGDGDDFVDGGVGNDTLRGGEGDDILIGGPDDNFFFDVLDGGPGDDFLIGSGGNDSLFGGGGSDIFFDKVGWNWLYGGGGDDLMGYFATYSDSGDRSIAYGDAGHDFYFWLGDEEDFLLNGWGVLVVLDFDASATGDFVSVLEFLYLSLQFGFSSEDPFAQGFLQLTYDPDFEMIVPPVGPGATHLSWDIDGPGPEQFYTVLTIMGATPAELADNFLGVIDQGTSGDDSLSGGGDDDLLVGQEGDDVLDGGVGADTMVGGEGRDTYYVDHEDDKLNETFTNEPAPLSGAPAALDDFTDTVVAAVTYSLQDVQFVENLTLSGAATAGTGNTLNNVITGNSRANTLNGLAGADTVNGRSGNDRLDGGTGNDKLDGSADTDTLAGGAGKDTLTGGTGQDKFDFNAALDASTNVDRIADFSAGADLIRLDEDIFTTLSTGSLAAAAFRSGPSTSTAGDASDRIIYNETNGNLYYDRDGTGAATAKLFATLAGAPAIDETDFFIVG